jgi:ubiquitin-protein ligase
MEICYKCIFIAVIIRQVILHDMSPYLSFVTNVYHSQTVQSLTSYCLTKIKNKDNKAFNSLKKIYLNVLIIVHYRELDSHASN